MPTPSLGVDPYLEWPGEEPRPSLNDLLHELYDRANQALAVDDRQPASPPLAPADGGWAHERLS